jgi:hypothetical protein
MEKKLTNNGPLKELADKHSIYTLFEKIYARLAAGLRDRPRLRYLGDAFDGIDGDIWRDSVHVPGEGNRIVAARITEFLATHVLRSTSDE